MTEQKRGPGRPKAEPKTDVADAAPIELADKAGRKFNKKWHESDPKGNPVVKDGLLVLRKRDARRPIGQSLKLDAREYQKANPGMYMAWFNDVAGKLNDLQERGFEFVFDDNKEPVKRNVGRGSDRPGGTEAYLMMLPEEFYKEDFIARQKQVVDADPRGVGKDEYVPGGGDPLRDDSPLA